MNQSTKLQRMITMSLLSALAFLIMYISFPLPIFPAFLEIDFSDVPALIGALMYGPVAGVIIELLKNLLHYFIKSSGTGVPIGEFANFLAGSVFIVVTALVYRRMHHLRGLIAGMMAGTLAMALVMAVANYYVIFPGYVYFLGFSMKDTISFASMANKSITDLFTLILYGVTPFNLVKGTVVMLLTIPLYQRLKPRMRAL